MSGTVTPSSNDAEAWQYYKDKVSEMESDKSDEIDAMQESHDKDLDRLQESRKKQIRDSQAETDETIQDVKDQANAQISRERERAQVEVQELKKQLYNRKGEKSDEASETLIKNAQKSYEIQHKKDAEKLEQAEKKFDRTIDQMHRQNRESVSAAVKAVKDSAVEQLRNKNDDQKSSLKQAQLKGAEQLARDREALIQERISDQKRALATLELAKQSVKGQSQSLDAAVEDRLNRQERVHNQNMTDAVARANKSHTEDRLALSTALKDYIEKDAIDQKGYNEGRERAIKEHDNDWRTLLSLQGDGYESQISDLKNKGDLAESFYMDKNERNLRERDTFFAKTIKDMNEDSRNRQQAISTAYKDMLDHADDQKIRNQKLYEHKSEVQAERSQKTNQEALGSQAEAFKNSMALQRDQSNQTQKILEKQLQEKSTSSDPTVISPAAEEAVRRATIDEYGKLFNESQKANNQKFMESRQHHLDLLNQTRDGAQDTIANLNRESQMNLQQTRGELMGHIMDVETGKAEALKNQEAFNNRAMDNMNRDQARMLEAQRRHYEEILSTHRAESKTELEKLRQESHFNEMMQHRKFTQAQADLSRAYESRMAEQKMDFEFLLDQVEADKKQTIEKLRRDQQAAMEELQQQHDQNKAQTELQNEERQKVVVGNLERELESTKRANARLIRAKS